MRPTKLLTISAIAGLSLISYGNSAHAAPVPVTLTGSVASSCTMTTMDSTGFSTIGEPATQLVANGGGARGKVTVICNDAAKSLNLTISSGSSQTYNGTPSIRLVGGGTTTGGVFGSTQTSFQLLASPIIFPLTAPTKAGGDIAYIHAKIEAPAGQLLRAAEDYNLVVDATITP